MPLLDFLDTKAVLPALRVSGKKQALQEISAHSARLLNLDEGLIFETLLQRERLGSTGIGEGVAIPHGTDASRALVRRTTLGVLQFPDGVDWDGQRVTICVAIAAKGDEHVTVLSALAQILMDPARAERLRTSASVDEVHELLSAVGEGIEV